MATKKPSIAPITVFTNGNKYDGKRFIFNPKYVRTFDAFLDQITRQTNATCAVRRIYTPHGSRQVGKLSSIEPGGKYVAVSMGGFKKVPYGQNGFGLSSAGTVTIKTQRKRKVSGRLQKSYEDQMRTQKTIYVHRNGSNEAPTQIFFTKRLLRSLSQVLDLVQEKIVCERAVVSLHKLNGVTVDDVSKLQAHERYVAVEQGQRFKHIIYDPTETGATSPRRINLPEIKPDKRRQRHLSNDSSQEQTSRSKAKIKLPVIIHKTKTTDGFQVVYGYAHKNTNDAQNTEKAKPKVETRKYRQFYASGAQQDIAMAIRDDKRVRVERPLNMIPARAWRGEQLDGVNHHRNEQPEGRIEAINPETRRTKDISLPPLIHAPKPPQQNSGIPIKPGLVHPHRYTHAQNKRRYRNSEDVTVPKGLIKDQRFVSQDNSMATTKRYVVTREQRLFAMHGRDGRDQARSVVDVYEKGARIKDLERENQELQKMKRIEDWVDHTVEVKQKEDEIAAVAKQLVTTALANAERTIETENASWPVLKKTNDKAQFNETSKNVVKYHRVFGQ